MSVPPRILDCFSWCCHDMYDQFVNLFPEEMSSMFVHVFFFFFNTIVLFNHDSISDSCAVSLVYNCTAYYFAFRYCDIFFS